jgi:RNA polymerase sigma-70 factor (ECF subfamily)
MANPNREQRLPRGADDGIEPTLFDRVYEQRFDEVLRWVRAFGVPRADQEDLVQEIFIIVHRRLGSFDGRNLSAWLYRITRRRVRDFKRLAWVQHFRLNRRSSLDDIGLVAENSEPLETRQRRKLLDQLLNTLGNTERATLVLFEMQGYSGKEIAKMQGVAVATVWTRIHRARRKLTAQLERRRRRLDDES